MSAIFSIHPFYFIREIAQCLRLNEGEIYSDLFLQKQNFQQIYSHQFDIPGKAD